MEGVSRPFSQRDTVACVTPSAAAMASCLMPFDRREILSFAPMPPSFMERSPPTANMSVYFRQRGDGLYNSAISRSWHKLLVNIEIGCFSTQERAFRSRFGQDITGGCSASWRLFEYWDRARVAGDTRSPGLGGLKQAGILVSDRIARRGARHHHAHDTALLGCNVIRPSPGALTRHSGSINMIF